MTDGLSELTRKVLENLSLTERFIFKTFAALLTISVIMILSSINTAFLTTVPASGGQLTEGIVGTPQFINPLLSLRDVERDLVSLIYSGLMRAGPDGRLIPDLAESFTVSEDNLVYTFRLKENPTFHDGIPVTADDIIFTIERTKHPSLKSVKRASFEGVTAEKTDDRTVVFTLRQPYPPFLENTTLGILPKHIWNDIPIEHFSWSRWNTEPIGSGPYRVERVKRNEDGIPILYSLKSFRNYALGMSKLSRLNVKFYSSERAALEALERGDIESLSTVSPKEATRLRSRGFNIRHVPLPHVFAVFFNQNEAPLFTDREVRRVLDVSINREALVKKILEGYGTTIENPFPPHIAIGMGETSHSLTQRLEATTTDEDLITHGRMTLEAAGWTYNVEKALYEKKGKKDSVELSFSLTTSNATELREAAELLKDQWERLGAKVRLQIFEAGDLKQSAIRPRKYDALLFGEIIGRDLDLFAFWHSSQRSDPGLNVALYTNARVDKLLEEARLSADRNKRSDLFAQFLREIGVDIPAVFLYSPEFIYVLPERVKAVSLGQITMPAERFLTINDWYVETNRVWRVFTH